MHNTLKKTLSIILTLLMIVTSIPFTFAADCVHDYSGEHFCLGYYCGNCNSYYGVPNPNGHYWFGEQCGICYETHEHTGNAGTICMGTLCELCYYPYGKVTDPDAHKWNSNGTCGYCGAECEHPSYTDGLCNVCGYKCPHDNSGEHFCLGYYCAACDSYYGEPNPALHQWINHECVICKDTHTGSGNAGTICLGTLCEICYYPYGKVTNPDAHKWNRNGTCGWCGAECEHPSYSDGVCDDCRYDCPHETYANGFCVDCGTECNHTFTNYEETEAPKCGVAGKEVAGCNNDCGAMNQREIPALTHKDDNGDNLCDNACGSEFAVIEGETYIVLGDITYTGLNYYVTDTPGCYKAGDGYAVIQPTDAGTEFILYNATIDVREEAVSGDSLENHAVCIYGDLNFTFIGTNTIYAKEGYDAFYNTGSSAEDVQLVISGAEGAVLNLYGGLFGYYITVKSGTINVYQDDPDDMAAIDAYQYFTVEKDAVVTAVGADNELFPNIDVISQRGITVEGVLNAFTVELLNAEEFSVALKVFGDVTAHQDIDVSLAAQEGVAIGLVIPEETSLTIPEDCTINLDSFNNIDIKGELIVNGTLICTHKGGEATCTEKAVCDVCDIEYGKTLGHKPLEAVVENEVYATCKAEGGYDLVVYCDLCGEEIDSEHKTTQKLPHTPSGRWAKNETEHWRYCVNESCSEEIESTRAEHKYENYTVTTPADCENNAEETGTCVCGATHKKEVENSVLEHKDDNGDYKCDYDCGYEFAVEPAPELPDTIILYTNDIHCSVDDYPALAAYAAELISQGNKVIIVDAGDAIPGDAYSNGDAIVEIMNAVGYDYAVPGEGEFEYGRDSFFNLAENKAEFKYISSNLHDLTSLTPVFNPYYITDIGENMQIAFIGISTPETATKLPDDCFKDEGGNYIYGFPMYPDGMTNEVLYDSVQESIDYAIADGADIVVAVGHLGIEGITEGWKSTDVIANTTGIDYFIDAHSHEVIKSEAYTNKDGETVTLTSGGNNFEYFGQITLKADGSIEFDLINPDTVDVEILSETAKNEYNNVNDLVQKYIEYVNAENCANGIHSFTKYETVESPECGKVGKEVATCDHGCGATAEKDIPALTHIDADNDGKCDHDCGTQISGGSAEEPGTPEDDCDHLCHKGGILGIFWKIISFFQRLFGIQQYCDCGVLHYDNPIFG